MTSTMGYGFFSSWASVPKPTNEQQEKQRNEFGVMIATRLHRVFSV